MKHTVQQEETKFSPIKVTLEIETKEELDYAVEQIGRTFGRAFYHLYCDLRKVQSGLSK